MKQQKTLNVTFLVVCIIAAVLLAGCNHSNKIEQDEEAILKVSMLVDLGADIGRNPGTLFEVTDSAGNVRAGAGFMGAYNTHRRNNRRIVSFFVKPFKQQDICTVESIGRPGPDAGYYLHNYNEKLFANTLGGKDDLIRYRDEEAKKWVPGDRAVLFKTHVGDGVLAVQSRKITYNDKPLLQLGDDEGQIGGNYYANGVLIFHHFEYNHQ